MTFASGAQGAGVSQERSGPEEGEGARNRLRRPTDTDTQSEGVCVCMCVCVGVRPLPSICYIYNPAQWHDRMAAPDLR